MERALSDGRAVDERFHMRKDETRFWGSGLMMALRPGPGFLKIVRDRMREHRPDLKVLFITSYAENATLANGFLDPGMSTITKPFAIDALATRIRSIIEAV